MSERQVEYTSGATVNGIECLLAFDAAGVLLGVLTGGYFTAYTEDQLRPHAAEKIDAARREIENDSITCKIHVARTAFGRDRFPVEAAVVKVRTRYIRTDSGDRPESYGYCLLYTSPSPRD